MALPILQEVMELMKTGTETEVRDFVKAHWEEFPQDIKDHLAVALMVDTISGTVPTTE